MDDSETSGAPKHDGIFFFFKLNQVEKVEISDQFQSNKESTKDMNSGSFEILDTEDFQKINLTKQNIIPKTKVAIIRKAIRASSVPRVSRQIFVSTKFATNLPFCTWPSRASNPESGF